MAGLGVGLWKSPDEIGAKWKAAATFEPAKSRDEADSLYEGWRKALDRARAWEEH